MSPSQALAAALARVFPMTEGARLGVAVSGGGDSMALMVLLADWCADRGVVLKVASVDHGLRTGAAGECAVAAAEAQRLGLEHTVLSWAGWNGKGNLQAEARAARYRLLGAWARDNELNHVCLGHTMDDQAETVLLRLVRGSGVDGLAGMAPERAEAGGPIWLRPLLEVSRESLRAELRGREVPWCEDPSNDDPGFDRVRARRLLENLKPLGLDREGLVDTAHRMAAARKALARVAAEAAERLAEVKGREISLAREGFLALSDETRWRLLSAALCQISGTVYRPRFDALRRLLVRLEAGGRDTLHGCLCTATATTFRICREPAAVAPPARAPGSWDGQWRIDCPLGSGLTVGALGENGIAERPDWRESGLSRDAALSSPALWQSGKLYAALLLENMPECRATLTWDKARFIGFLLSD